MAARLFLLCAASVFACSELMVTAGEPPDSRQKAGSVITESDWQTIERLFKQYLPDRSNDSQIEDGMRRFRQMEASGNIPAVINAFDHLLPQIAVEVDAARLRDIRDRLLKEQERQGQRERDEVEKLKIRVQNAIREDARAEDLDALIAELRPADESARAHRQLLESDYGAPRQEMLEICKAWQSYLAGKAGKSPHAVDELWDVARRSSGEIVPRSKLLNAAVSFETLVGMREQEVKEAALSGEARIGWAGRQLLRGAKSPADIPRVKAALENLPDLRPAVLASVITQLSALADCSQRIDEGAGCSLRLFGEPELHDLRLAILRKALPAILFSGSTPAIRPGQSMAAYIKDAIERGKQQGDAQLLVRAATLRWILDPGFFLAQAELQTALYFQEAQNYDKARFPAVAIPCYVECLKSASDIVPATWIADRIDELSHRGRMYYLTFAPPDPSPPDLRNSTRSRPGYPYSQMGYYPPPPAEPPQRPNSIEIPAIR